MSSVRQFEDPWSAMGANALQIFEPELVISSCASSAFRPSKETLPLPEPGARR
jgi:hypothetical protein